MLLLILYYVHQWMTVVPWSYYESAKSRRILYQPTNRSEQEKQVKLQKELRCHELIGLIWVLVSPAMAGYTLRYSQYLLSNVDHYVSSFNITVFVLAASIRPLSHIITMLHERTLFLHSESMVKASQVELLEAKVDQLEKQVHLLHQQTVKRQLEESADLAKALKRAERRQSSVQEQLAMMDTKVREVDGRLDQQTHPTLVQWMLLPFYILLWVTRYMTMWISILESKKKKHLV
ncbi:uncharacterized protein B0P05DRAFT_476717 [Gilbertella persicaria]|uniref:uncharacterized protein n=1 Tax=Gilbertella persicaria TaxID=101096 RepID=UPI00221F8AC1|nr:uncharacterized protein B0P05DRAFT_476717 [Gilbertella persicaria]KAI8063648.1 hypothetical protein B0P05DRAFT_476717 [Gilbertella persicaria]